MGRRQEKGNCNERGQVDATSESDTSYANRKRRYVKNKHSTICTMIPSPRAPRKADLCKHKKNTKNPTNNAAYRTKDCFEDECLNDSHENQKGKYQSCHQCTKSKFSSKSRTNKQYDNYDNTELSGQEFEINEESLDHLNDSDKGKSLLKNYGNIFDKCIAEEFEVLLKCEKCKEEELQRKKDSKTGLRTSRATQANRLTKEQLKLIAMDKPPLDKLSEIPLRYLKPRPPSHYRQNERPKSILANNCFPEANFEGFVQSITERAHSVQSKGEPIMEDVGDWLESGPALGKKASDPQPYLHPNVEKLFSRDTTKKALNISDEKTVSTQTDIKWENILQSTLFYEMDLERKAPFVFDLHKLQNDNWREALAQQEEPDRVPINPLLSYSLKRNRGLHNICFCCSGVPLEKHQVSDKSVNTDPLIEKRVTFGKCTIMNTYTTESDDSEEQAEPSTQVVNKETIDKTQNLRKGGGDALCKNSTLNTQTPSPSKSEKDIYESALKGDLKQGDYLTCLKIIDNITCAMLELDFNDSLKLAAGGDHLKQMQKLREDHLKHIQKEVHHLEELDKFLKKFSTQDSDS